MEDIERLTLELLYQSKKHFQRVPDTKEKARKAVHDYVEELVQTITQQKDRIKELEAENRKLVELLNVRFNCDVIKDGIIK